MRKAKSVKFLPSLILLLIAPLLANLVGCEAHSSFRAAKDKTPPSFALAKDKIHPSFQGAKKARIIIKEDYGQAKRVSLASDIIKLTSGLLRHAGVEVVTEPVETDFTINVDVKGKALEGHYIFMFIGGNRYCYPGVEVKIVVLFEAKDGYKIEEKGEGRKGLPGSIPEGAYQSPDDASFWFWETLNRPAIESIEKLLYKSFGITPLISALKDENWRVRDTAADALDKINPRWPETDEAKKAVPEFILALRNENWGVRKAAADALGKIKDRRALKPLISALKDWHIPESAHEVAADALDKINPRWRETDEAKKAVPKFISALKDKDSGVRKAAADALDKINPRWRETDEAKKAVPKFISALKSWDPEAREVAAKALGKIKDPRAVKPLISTLKGEALLLRKALLLIIPMTNLPGLPDDSFVREAAAWALGEIKDPRAVEPLISAVKDRDEDIRKAAAEALTKINPRWRETDEAKKAVSESISALKDKDPSAREAAVDALDRINPRWRETDEAKKAVSESISALKDGESFVRKTAADALGKIKDPRAVEPLISALKDENWIVRMVAADALTKITNQKFGEDYKAWQKWWQENKAKYSR